MLARAAAFPLAAGYAFEVKWDGFRAIVDALEGVRAYSRRGWNMTALIPELASFPARGVFDGGRVRRTRRVVPAELSAPL